MCEQSLSLGDAIFRSKKLPPWVPRQAGHTTNSSAKSDNVLSVDMKGAQDEWHVS